MNIRGKINNKSDYFHPIHNFIHRSNIMNNKFGHPIFFFECGCETSVYGQSHQSWLISTIAIYGVCKRSKERSHMPHEPSNKRQVSSGGIETWTLPNDANLLKREKLYVFWTDG